MRCFVALWPDTAAATGLAAIGAQLCRDAVARRLAAADLHLTLAFIGDLPEATAQALAGAVALEFNQASSWLVDHAGVFPKARVLWVAGARDPILGALADAVRAGLRRFGVPFDGKEFVPHLTLARSFRAVEPFPRGLATPVPCHFGPPRLARSISGGSRRYAIVGPTTPLS